jgi:hypothetical protein
VRPVLFGNQGNCCGVRNVKKIIIEIIVIIEIIIIIIIIIEIQRMWSVKTKVTPVIIGATGTVSKSFGKYLSNMPGKHDIKELQKTAILGTAHTLRKVLM